MGSDIITAVPKRNNITIKYYNIISEKAGAELI
jgi:hypothetical protein